MPEPEVKYNQDELVPPTFLNQDFIITILKSVEEDPKLKVIKDTYFVIAITMSK